MDSKQVEHPNLSRWFWGTIILLACASILLTIIGAVQKDTNNAIPRRLHSGELSPTALESVLTKSNILTLREVAKEIDPLLDQIYTPVYRAIPAYVDFHYSLKGEYVELTEAALGYVSAKLREKLFTGLEERLNGAATKLDDRFNENFRQQVAANLARVQPDTLPGPSLGPLTRAVVDDAKARISVTAPLAGVISAGGYASLKAASALFAKKLGAKIATKVAAKTGAKWAAAAGGAGSGTAICSWAGPGAAVCAAGGAVIAWVATDMAVIKLDEILNREEFEAEIRKLVDEDKAATRALLEKALSEKATKVQAGSDRAVQDFTLRQLSGADSAAACATAAALVTQYNFLQDNFRERQPASLTAFRRKLIESEKDISLRRLAREIEENLATQAYRFTIPKIVIRGNVPPNFRENREVSGRLLLNGRAVQFKPSSANKNEGFALESFPALTLSGYSPLKMELALEQHRRLFENRLFGGVADRDLFDKAPTKGLKNNLVLHVPIEIDEDADSVLMVNARPVSGYAITVEIELQGQRLADLEFVPNCVHRKQP